MADYVSVANLALSLLGEDDQLRDPDEDTHAARTVRAVWDEVRQAVLREGEWNFAIKRFKLAAVVDPSIVAFPYAAAFELPDGFLRLIEILDPPPLGDYSLEGGHILSDATGALTVRCVVDVVEIGLWDALFRRAFAHYLGYQIADRITGDRGRKSDCFQGFQALVSKAKGADAIENPPVVIDEADDSWLQARFS